VAGDTATEGQAAGPAAPQAVALRIAYDGSAFHSYARQPGRRTTEGALIGALRHEGYVEGSFKAGSRTDAGVCALENVCRAAVRRKTLRGLVPALQKHCPDGLWVTAAAPVAPDWNPRHARRRTYRYEAVSRGEDPARLEDACAAFVGRHDMRAFARMEEGRKPERNVFAFAVEADGPLWSFRVSGDGFLWNQVRRMCSAVLAVGRGEAEVADIQASLASGRPHGSFGLAPPEGLTLERVEYDGLEWDPLLGRLGPQLVRRPLLSARARLGLATHLRDLAPWPSPGPAE
jgi:tRNA pseudouridine38-40 synthase